jgi:hypothetical protein
MPSKALIDEYLALYLADNTTICAGKSNDHARENTVEVRLIE